MGGVGEHSLIRRGKILRIPNENLTSGGCESLTVRAPESGEDGQTLYAAQKDAGVQACFLNVGRSFGTFNRELGIHAWFMLASFCPVACGCNMWYFPYDPT